MNQHAELPLAEQWQLTEQSQASLYRYARAVDEHDLSRLADLVTDDVQLFRVDGLHQGRDAFLAVYRQFFASPIDWSRHLITNVEVALDPAGGAARSHAYFEAAMTDSTAAWLVFGEYRHDMVRTDGQWRFRGMSIDVQRKLKLVRS